MIGSNAFNYINVLNKAANATLTRYDVIANNIANVDTPNYKRQDVQFESYLKSALSEGESLDQAVANADLNSLDPTVYTDNADLSYRLDGNNVDMETEQTYLADSQIRYYALLDSMSQEFSRIKTVLSAR
jgi:flagellar basal-body rod protein FlgB